MAPMTTRENENAPMAACHTSGIKSTEPHSNVQVTPCTDTPQNILYLILFQILTGNVHPLFIKTAMFYLYLSLYILCTTVITIHNYRPDSFLCNFTGIGRKGRMKNGSKTVGQSIGQDRTQTISDLPLFEQKKHKALLNVLHETFKCYTTGFKWGYKGDVISPIFTGFIWAL